MNDLVYESGESPGIRIKIQTPGAILGFENDAARAGAKDPDGYKAPLSVGSDHSLLQGCEDCGGNEAFIPPPSAERTDTTGCVFFPNFIHSFLP